MRHLRLFAAASLLACVWPAGTALGNVTLPALISDHMVLQQGMPVRVWGKADPGEQVRVKFQGQTVQTAADSGGKWEAWLKPLKAGAAAAQLTVAGNNTIVVQDVLVGEVWIGSGQSNMQWMVANSNNADEEIKNAKYPHIRLFQVKMQVADTAQADTEGSWRLCDPETVGKFSAVEYFFGRDLHRHLKVPMGLIQSAWGGTPAQSWASRGAIDADPALKFIGDEWEKVLANYPAAKEKYEAALTKWKATPAEARKGAGPRPPAGPGHQNTPGGLYNAMIAPLTPFAMRGVIWYQGESNATPPHAEPYRRLFRTMIEDWRAKWGIGSFPFLFVQLANFKANPHWPVLRESQTATLELRNTGMAVIIDIGESGNIHPKNKQEVGRRLMLSARAVAYGEKLVHSGPLFRELTSEGSQLRAWFDFASRGLRARDGAALTGFEIAGADGNFVPAQASIDGETVVASSPSVPAPVALRYAWADDPVCNLTNAEGLPASPFRSR